jgi:hypothetical protein
MIRGKGYCVNERLTKESLSKEIRVKSCRPAAFDLMLLKTPWAGQGGNTKKLSR